MDKSSINIFEVKPVRKDIGFKISAGDVFNQFLYLGDEKGNIHFYPIRVGEADIIPKSQNQTTKNISKYKIDKILCYPQISMVIVLAGQSLYAVDSALRRSQVLASKISDFAINQTFSKESQTYSVTAITRKKQGFIFVYNPTTKKLEDIKTKFSVSQVPSCLAYTGQYIIIATKRQYECLNVNKSFAMKKAPLSAKFPFMKAVNPNEIVILSDDIGLLMSPDFQPRPKDSIVVNRPVLQITLAGNYCFFLCDNCLQVYLNYDKKFSLVQQLPINVAKGITNQRPFIYNKQDLYFLYEIPYETQIKSLLQKCRIDDAISLLIQNVGTENEQKIQQLKINAVWPLLRKMQFDKVKELIRGINFDIRQLIILYPQLVSLQINAIKGAKASKTIATLIIQFISQKATKGKDEETELKKRSKLFLKEVLQIKREYYLSQGNNTNRVRKRSFYVSKSSLINGRFEEVTPQQMLEIIDFTLIKWFFEMGMLRHLEEFLLTCSKIYCQKQFGQLQETFRKNPKLLEVPTLKPRLFSAFQKYDQAYENWQKVAEASQKDTIIKTACEQAVTLLDKFQDRSGLFDRMSWILRLRPEIAMNFFTMVPLNFIPPDQIIKKLQTQKQYRYLELYLETIVINKNTQVQAYHTKLMLLYLNSLFEMHPKQNKQEGKDQQFLQKLAKFRKLEKSSTAKYVSEPILNKIQKCEWLLEDQIYLYSRQKRHEAALKKYISKNMSKQAQRYCEMNGQQTLTIYFRMLLTMYKSYQSSKNNSALLLKKDILVFLKQHASSPQLDPLVVLELIPDDWMLNDFEGVGGIYQFLQSSITHTLHEKRTTQTAKYLSQMDLLNSEYNLIQAKRAYLRFTVKKKCCICNGHIADKVFVVYPNANVCHQGCVKKDKNTICPVTKQDFQKTFKY